MDKNKKHILRALTLLSFFTASTLWFYYSYNANEHKGAQENSLKIDRKNSESAPTFTKFKQTQNETSASLGKNSCQGLSHWKNIDELLDELQANDQLEIVWATWHGYIQGKKVAWQLFINSRGRSILETNFFYLDENDVPIKENNPPTPFQAVIGKSLIEIVDKLENVTTGDGHWQFALGFTHDEKMGPSHSIMWEENVGFTHCD